MKNTAPLFISHDQDAEFFLVVKMKRERCVCAGSNSFTEQWVSSIYCGLTAEQAGRTANFLRTGPRKFRKTQKKPCRIGIFSAKINTGLKAISYQSNDRVMANFADYGFRGVITKPYKPSELGGILSRILSE